ncbi:MAG: cytidine deaminase [Deltaproteobacteria bacterium]|nr:cytidine deaminase [Deltaproteobacteria bacterium]
MSGSKVPWASLAKSAERVRGRAHAPYSHYRVGAALLTTGGVVTGCNVENASYPLCICAEGAAVARAVAMGRRRWRALAVATPGPEPGAPCGACRQILAEFAPPTLPIALVVDGVVVRRTTLGELLPLAFSGKTLDGSVKEPEPT